MKKPVGLLLFVVVITGLLAFVTGGNVAQADDVVVPPGEDWEGHTYADLSAEWWQWALALPAYENHPLLVEGETDCSLGQSGDVWFFAGTGFGDIKNVSLKRTCQDPIPAGKALFFPVVNVFCSEFTGDGPEEEGWFGCAEYVTDHFLFPLAAKVDEEQIRDLEAYRTISPLFYVDPLPDPNYFGKPEGTEGGAVGGGYYLLVPPLSAGKHQIKFTGRVYAPDYGIDTTLRVHYYFTVEDSE